ncbi:PDZ domain-containing protein [Stenotrophomonas maltophilia]|uniref:PDZ domain-containing protein n=1 Tax=Stenotrophomonas maltophilia TaxID=40324 RepID=UPI003BF88C39
MAVAVGLIMLLFSCSMDTSVPMEYGGRVNNIGLMHTQTLLVFVSLGAILIGMVMWIAGRKKPASSGSNAADVRVYGAEEIKDIEVLLSGKARTGIVLRSDDPKAVAYVAPKSPASLAGVIAGDRLIEIDGLFPTTDLRENSVLLAGDDGSEVAIKLRRGSEAVDLLIKRAIVFDAVPGPLTSQSSPGSRQSPTGGVWLYIVILALGLVALGYRLLV